MARRQITRQEILDVLQEFVFDRGGQVTLREFVSEAGIAESQIRKHFGSWTDLRKEHGWTGDERDHTQHTDETLWEAYHSLVERLRRFPTNAEIDQHSAFAARTYYTRFGTQAKMRMKYARWLHKQQASGGRQSPDEGEQTGPPADVRWLRNRWQQLRITFALCSSEFRGRQPHEWDLIVVLDHDWPACPVKVIRLSDILPETSNVQPTAWVSNEPTRTDLYGRMPWDR